MSASIARLFKGLRKLLPPTRKRRPIAVEEHPPTMPPPVLGVGVGSLFFPREESGK